MMISSRKRNRYTKLKIRTILRLEDIRFLKRCEKARVFPNFIENQMKVNKGGYGAQEGIRRAKIFWLKHEVRRHYGKNMRDNREIYSLQLEIMREMSNIEWSCFVRRVDEVILSKRLKKINHHKKKFNDLREKCHLVFKKKIPNSEPEPKNFPFVVNKSNEDFTYDQMTLLNKGLKYCPPPNKIPCDELAVSVETVLQKCSNETKAIVRNNFQATITKQKTKYSNEQNIIKELKQKEVVYSYPDKGKAVVIMNKNEYMKAVQDHIDSGPYSICKVRSQIPVDSIQSQVKRNLVKMVSIGLLDEDQKKKFLVTNPRIPRMYGLPKIHKPGFQIRPVVTTIDDPTSKIASYLIKNFRNFRKFESRGIKNSFEFTKLIREEEINENELMVSFDVTALYPSIPEKEATLYLKEWISSQDISYKMVELCCELLDIVVSQRIFQFNNVLYQQLEGVKIGGSLSSWQAEIFMSRMEMKFLDEPWAPRTYHRYVDDIFCIVDKENVDTTLKHLNSQHTNIKFTNEIENDSKIPFLDILIERKNGKFEFGVYRKPTDSPLTIPSDSHTPRNYKMAAYESMMHRLFNLPLSKSSFENEKLYIYEVARINGYDREEIEKIEKKHLERGKLKQTTTLKCIKEKEENNFMVIPYHPPMTDRLAKYVKKRGINSIYTSGVSLGRQLINLKDKRENSMKSGIYEISCKSCESKYIGQSRRRVHERWKEHENAYRLKQPNKSAVAEHMLSHKHEIGDKKLIREVTNPYELNAWESYHIETSIGLMNMEEAPINSKLFKFSHNFK